MLSVVRFSQPSFPSTRISSTTLHRFNITWSILRNVKKYYWCSGRRTLEYQYWTERLEVQIQFRSLRCRKHFSLRPKTLRDQRRLRRDQRRLRSKTFERSKTFKNLWGGKNSIKDGGRGWRFIWQRQSWGIDTTVLCESRSLKTFIYI